MAICGIEIFRRSLFILNVTLVFGIIFVNGIYVCLFSCLKVGNVLVLIFIVFRFLVVK